MSLLVYGAYGYTGALIVEEARRRGLRPVLAGRDASRLEAMGDQTGLETRVCALDERDALVEMLGDIGAVIHAAGPFTRTWRSMAEACLASGTHYLDITGEIPVFEKLAVMDHEAKERGVMTMPGVGFDVVPSDCVAAHLKRRLPTATRLELAVSSGGVGPSRGTMHTLLRHAGRAGLVRRAGRLVPEPVGRRRRSVEFGSRRREVISIPWGDLSSAFQTTGVPDITCYFDYPGPMRHLATRLHWFRPLIQSRPVQWLLHRGVDLGMRPGPDAVTRKTARSHVWGEMRDDDGRSVRCRIVLPEIYALTALTSVEIAVRVLGGEARPGYWTPAKRFGPDFILGFPGVEREDVK